jgi:CspA family cold shock protein
MTRRGRVRWFNQTKGYGFIETDGGETAIFVHHSVIEGRGYRTLKEGQAVEFEMRSGPKGAQATLVRKAEI